ncbi:MAG: DUF3253 domain-containing protein [Maricaulaceae bacterium]
MSVAGDIPDRPESLEAAILRLADARGPGKSLCPSEAARAFDPKNWRARMRQVRAAAVGLARRGEIVITRKGKVVDPDDFRGVYRLARPSSGGASDPE